MIIVKCRLCGIIGHLKGNESDITSRTNMLTDHEIQGKEHEMAVFNSDKIYSKVLKNYMDKKNISKLDANRIAESVTKNQQMQFLRTAKNYKEYVSTFMLGTIAHKS